MGRKPGWEWVTDEMFDDELERQVGNLSSAEILAIPEVNGLLREELNNVILEALAEEEERCMSCGSELMDNGECFDCDGPECCEECGGELERTGTCPNCAEDAQDRLKE
jgi:hypothetical protein